MAQTRPYKVCVLCKPGTPAKPIYNHLNGDKNQPICSNCNQKLNRDSNETNQGKLLRASLTVLTGINQLLTLTLPHHDYELELDVMRERILIMNRIFAGESRTTADPDVKGVKWINTSQEQRDEITDANRRAAEAKIRAEENQPGDNVPTYMDATNKLRAALAFGTAVPIVAAMEAVAEEVVETVVAAAVPNANVQAKIGGVNNNKSAGAAKPGSYQALYSLSTRGLEALGPWEDMLTDPKRLKPVILRSKDKILDLTDPKVREQYIYKDERRKKGEQVVHRYYDEPIPGEPLSENTLFIYEPGRYKLSGGHKVEIAGVYLKDVIHEDVWRTALGDPTRNLPGLRTMHWVPPTRSETRPGVERQKDQEVQAAERAFGGTHQGSINKHSKHAHETDEQTYAALEPLFKMMDLIFVIVLPSYWLDQSQPKTVAERTRIQASIETPKEWGGALNRFKHFGTSFTNAALLKSCPAAIHQDNNAKERRLSNFTCLTTCGEDVKGGTFCLIEYGIKIAVKPGDLLLCQTSREWHCNLGPVTGKEKYSIVAYYQPGLGNPRMKTTSGPEETMEDRLKDWETTAEEGDFFDIASGQGIKFEDL